MIESCCVCGNRKLDEIVVSRRHDNADLFLSCPTCDVRIRVAEAPCNIEYYKWSSELDLDLFLRHRFLSFHGDESILNLFCGGNFIVFSCPRFRIDYADFSKDALPSGVSNDNWWQVGIEDDHKYKSMGPIDHQYDIILLLDVLEHTKNPIALLEFAKSLLKENGKILIETGNVDLLSLNGWYFHHSDHVLGLTMKTLNITAAKCGLDVTSSLYVKNKMWLRSSRVKRFLIYVLRISKSLPSIRNIVYFFLKIDVQMLADPYLRDHIFVVFENIHDTAP